MTQTQLKPAKSRSFFMFLPKFDPNLIQIKSFLELRFLSTNHTAGDSDVGFLLDSQS